VATERQQIRGDRDKASYTELNKGIRASVAVEVERCLRLWGSAGRAAEVLTQCREWRCVEHIIFYNADGLDQEDVAAMMQSGRRKLASIPGVREVFAGEAVKRDGGYRYCWRIRFASEAVIDSYREHPEHVAFANNYFRPFANDRISIDFQATLNYEPKVPQEKLNRMAIS
jgi:fructose-bisphosphate aldolase class II